MPLFRKEEPDSATLETPFGLQPASSSPSRHTLDLKAPKDKPFLQPLPSSPSSTHLSDSSKIIFSSSPRKRAPAKPPASRNNSLVARLQQRFSRLARPPRPTADMKDIGTLEEVHLDEESGSSGDELKKKSLDLTKSPLLAPEQAAQDSRSDVWNFILLVSLYMFQGIPFGLAFGSIPFLLKATSQAQGASYTDIGIFSLASYPYTLKILWSPIVDAVFSRRFGRRRSWIFPMQLCIGATFLWMGQHVEQMVFRSPPNILGLTVAFIFLITLCATQDVAVDGWAITILSKRNIRFGSAAQTVGLNTGYFLSFTVFLALSSADFCNKYLRWVPQPHGLVSLNPFLTFWGCVCLFLTVIVLFKKEADDSGSEPLRGVSSAYQTIWSMTKLPYMKTLILVLFFHKFGYLANEAISPLKLIEKGFRKEDLALVVLIDFPFQILFGFLTVKWSSGTRPLRPWLYATYARHVLAIFGMLVIYFFPKHGVNTAYFVLVISLTVVTSLMSTIMFVSQGAFFAVISDPLVGGTYMTFLHTFSNFAGTWPRYFIFEGVDLFSRTQCLVKNATSQVVYACSNEAQKALCRKLNGTCEIDVDGFYIVAGGCMVLGLLVMILFIHRQAKRIEKVPVKAWRLNENRVTQ